MTVPTIAELKGNTVLELFNSGYNALKDDVNDKQKKLTAGDNIVLTDDGVISAIVGGSATLDNYYTKSETDALLDDKADSEDVYTKDETDDAIQAVANELPDMTLYYTKEESYSKAQVNNLLASKVVVITPEVTSTGSAVKFTEELKGGDLIVAELKNSDNVLIDTIVFGVVSSNGTSIVNKVAVSSQTDNSNFYYTFNSYRVAKTSNVVPEYTIQLLNRQFKVTNGLVSIDSSSYGNSFSALSKVYIYRVPNEEA